MKKFEPLGRLFQVQKTLEPAAARAMSRRTRFEGEASADEACSPGSGAVQVRQKPPKSRTEPARPALSAITTTNDVLAEVQKHFLIISHKNVKRSNEPKIDLEMFFSRAFVCVWS